MAGAVGHKLHILAEMLDASHSQALYHRLVSHWKKPAELVIGGYESPTVLTDPARWASVDSFFEHMMYCDTVTYLADDIFTKVDRASMAVSLEARVPVLDHRVVEFAWTLPLSMKRRDGQGKWILRQVLYKYVPRALIDRPKMGFGVPIDSWLRGPLRDWAENLLNEPRLKNEGYLNPKEIQQKWAQHLSGERNWSYYLWDILMFQSWLERWGKNGVPPAAGDNLTPAAK
jgi:asparagine synthase (glutamine-hydrolysing)